MLKAKFKFFTNNERLPFNGTSFISGLVPTLIVILTYYIISLLDLWPYFPPIVQTIFYLFTLLVGSIFLLLGFFRKIKYSQKKATASLAVCICIFTILALSSGTNFVHLTTLAFKPRSLFDYPVAYVTAVVTAPEYLQKEPVQIFFTNITEDGGELNPIHEGSIINVHVEGLDWAPIIKLSDGKVVPFKKQKNGDLKANIKISNQIWWSLNQGSRSLGTWPIIIIEDQEPKITKFSLEDHANDKGYLTFDVDVIDDRKIINTFVELINSNGIIVDRKALALEDIISYNRNFYLDFSRSKYAGFVVDVKLSVEDEMGQVSSFILENIKIPIKTYRHPVAGKLISLYHELGQKRPEFRSITRQIKALGLLPDAEGLPPIYYVAMRSAYWRLSDYNNHEGYEVARNLLWDTAQKIENSDMGIIENNLIASLDKLALLINQKQSVQNIREGLRSVDGFFQDYIVVGKTTTSHDYSLDVDIQSVRKLYSYILAFSDQKKYHSALLMVNFISKGLVQNNNLILSGNGLGHYLALSEGRKIIDNLILVQKKLLSNSYNEEVRDGLIINKRQTNGKIDLENVKHSQFILQSKVGDAMKALEKKVSFASKKSNFLLKSASVLVEEILAKMTNNEINKIALSQSELVVIMGNLKRELGKPILKSPEFQNIMKEINFKPTL